MKFIYLKRVKVRGLGIEKFGVLLWVYFCMDRGCGWLGVEAKFWFFRIVFFIVIGDFFLEGVEFIIEYGIISFFFGVG